MENNCNKIEMRKKIFIFDERRRRTTKKYIGMKNTSEGMKQRVKEAEVTVMAWEAIVATEAILYSYGATQYKK